MLVLSRKLGEVIRIGNDITITVTDIDRGKVRLGITAPVDVPILRDELLRPPPIEMTGAVPEPDPFLPVAVEVDVVPDPSVLLG